MNPIRLGLAWILACTAAVANASREVLEPAADELDRENTPIDASPRAGQTVESWYGALQVPPPPELTPVHKWDPWHPTPQGLGAWTPPEAAYHLPPGESFFQEDGGTIRVGRVLFDEPGSPPPAT